MHTSHLLTVCLLKGEGGFLLDKGVCFLPRGGGLPPGWWGGGKLWWVCLYRGIVGKQITPCGQTWVKQYLPATTLPGANYNSQVDPFLQSQANFFFEMKRNLKIPPVLYTGLSSSNSSDTKKKLVYRSDKCRWRSHLLNGRRRAGGSSTCTGRIQFVVLTTLPLKFESL